MPADNYVLMMRIVNAFAYNSELGLYWYFKIVINFSRVDSTIQGQ